MIKQEFYAKAINPTTGAKKGSGHLFVEVQRIRCKSNYGI